MTSQHVRNMNFVNMGTLFSWKPRSGPGKGRTAMNFTLYSKKPWSTVKLRAFKISTPPHNSEAQAEPGVVGVSTPPHNSVNLGDFYKIRRQPLDGWAYLDDGSVFLSPSGWTEHDVLQARLRLAAQYVRDPTPQSQVIRRNDPDRRRLLVINKPMTLNTQPNTVTFLARNARDGERVTVPDEPVENVVLSLNETSTVIVSATVKDATRLNSAQRVQNSIALRTFRGTLVDGILQPNVRLGNGLKLSANEKLPRNGAASTKQSSQPSAPRQDASQSEGYDLKRREAKIVQRERDLLLLQQQLVLQSNHQSGPTAPQAATALTPEFERRVAELEAKERELEQREELLRWKRKTWLLEQKLARVRGKSISTGHMRTVRKSHTSRPVAEEPRHHSMGENFGSKQQFDLSGDLFPDSEVNNDDYAAPPEALMTLRKRMRLPTPRTLRSGQTWHPD